MKEISSSANAQFKIWRSLLNSRGIKNENLFLLSGEKIIKEFLKNPNFKIQAEILRPGSFPLQSQAPVFVLSKDLFNELDVVGTHFNLLVLEAKSLSTSKASDEVLGLEVIIPVGDPHNLGALVRSCVAFGVTKIHLTTETVHPFHPKSLKASAGSMLHAPLYQSGTLIDWDHPSVMALDAKGLSLLEFKKTPNQGIRILVGEEGPGLPPLCQVTKVSIPTMHVESLNATVAASLMIWELSKENLKN